MKKAKILIMGASGMLGACLLNTYAKSKNLDVIGTVRDAKSALLLPSALHSKLRVGIKAEDHKAIQMLLADERPDIVINCIGIIKQLDESKKELPTIWVNALFPHVLAQYCDLFGARMIQISTDCVFSGKQNAAERAYNEDSAADAQDLYGRSKYLGEIHRCAHVVTLRTSIIGHELASARSLIDWFLSQNGQVRGFTRAWFSGLPTVELARIIHDYVLPNPRLTGLYHVAARPINKYELLHLVGEIYGHNIKIIPDGTIVINRSLDASRFSAFTGYQPPNWSELVAQMHAHKIDC